MQFCGTLQGETVNRSERDLMWKNELRAAVKDCRFEEGAKLADYTTFRVGGPAALLAEPETEEALCALLDLVEQKNIPCLLIGNGSNLLVKDGGFDGLAIHLGASFAGITADGDRIQAQAGALLSKTAVFAVDHALAGMAFAHGIPGSLGGAVYMNAGAYGGEMSHIVESVRVWTPEGVKVYSCEDMHFSYRHSRLMDEKAVVLSAVLKLEKGDEQLIRDEMKKLLTRRKEKQPLEYPSAGSFFKRPAGHFAGALIENAGLKGFAIGGAKISEKHAGFLINFDHATARDVLDVMKAVQDQVFALYGVHLENEVRIVGKDK